ncbi:hypothetical protein [Arthrospiribacter ruber]|nr:hypothetical protein [Arthrospiribacter ruber]
MGLIFFFQIYQFRTLPKNHSCNERNMDNPFSGIAESIGYFRGVMVATKP